jgi:hypothetical protein
MVFNKTYWRASGVASPEHVHHVRAHLKLRFLLH